MLHKIIIYRKKTMEYILFSFILAGLPTLYTGYCNKMRDLIRLVFIITFIVIYYINQWKTSDINIGLFICWCVAWTMFWDYLYKKFKRK